MPRETFDHDPFADTGPSNVSPIPISLPERTLRSLLVGIDIVCISSVWVTLVVVSPSVDGLAVGTIACMVALLWLATHDMYYATGHQIGGQSTKLYEAAGLAAVAANIADSQLDAGIGARGLIFCAIAGGLALHTGRLAFQARIVRAQREGRHLRVAVVVGEGSEAEGLAHRLRAKPELGYAVAATIDPAQSAQVARIARAAGGETVMVVPGALSAAELARVVRDTTNAGLHVHLVGATSGIDPRRVQSRSLGREASVHISRVALDGWQAVVKRAFDLVIATIVLVVTLPILVAAALSVKLGDRGPVLFEQERIGRRGRPFVMYKFRSMVVDAEALLVDLRDHNQRDGPLFKISRDPRITRVGRVLRATSIDELPQLWNVLKGDMSLVGPRPALAREVEQFSENLRRRTTVLPGITGLWQIEGRDDPDFAIYEETDIFYVENWSVRLDAVILFRTFTALVKRVGRKLLSRKPEQMVVLD